MTGHHHHGHPHDQHHGPASHGRAFAIGIALNLGFVALETVWGLKVNSLALLADAGHNLSDVLALVLAWGAAWLETRPATSRRTYGLGRATIWAALINALMLLVAVGGIGWESVGRLNHPVPQESTSVMAIAALGILVNGGTALLFMRGAKGDLNVRGAFLHMVGDAAVSLAVVIAAFVVGLTGWAWLDPAISLGIAALIAWSSLGLLRSSLALGLDGVPDTIDHAAVEDFLMAQPGVTGLHDLHIWPLSTNRTALTVHLIMPGGHEGDDFLDQLADGLHDHFRIDHATIQIERGDEGRVCRLAEAHGR